MASLLDTKVDHSEPGSSLEESSGAAETKADDPELEESSGAAETKVDDPEEVLQDCFAAFIKQIAKKNPFVVKDVEDQTTDELVNKIACVITPHYMHYTGKKFAESEEGRLRKSLRRDLMTLTKVFSKVGMFQMPVCDSIEHESYATDVCPGKPSEYYYELGDIFMDDSGDHFGCCWTSSDEKCEYCGQMVPEDSFFSCKCDDYVCEGCEGPDCYNCCVNAAFSSNGRGFVGSDCPTEDSESITVGGLLRHVYWAIDRVDTLVVEPEDPQFDDVVASLTDAVKSLTELYE